MAKYISKYLNLRLINKASYTKEVDGRVVVVPGKSIQFDKGVYETNDKDEIAFLDNHPNCGSVFIKMGEKDIEKARKTLTQDLEARQKEETETKAAKERKEKALEEGAEMPKKRGRIPKVEKPKF